MKRVHVYFSGSVQGVGFRYTVERLARHFPVTGFVQNRVNGQVELVAEGQEDSLKDFLGAIRQGDLRHHIRDVVVDWEDATGEYRTFGVAF